MDLGLKGGAMAKDSDNLSEVEYHAFQMLRSGRWSRRDFMKHAGAMGIGAAMAGTIIDAVLPGGLAAAATPVKGGVGRIGIDVPSALPDPVTMADEGAIVTTQIAGEYLVYPDTNWNLQPMLATSWSSPSATKFVFKLRQGVKFHSGQEMTSADVVATFQTLCNPSGGSAGLSAFAGILVPSGVVATDTYTVTFNLESPFVDFPYLLSPFSYNSIILPANYKPGTFMSTPQGTGAYMVSSYTPAQGATFVANPKYWGSGGPYMTGINLTYYSDPSTGVLDMVGGQYDYFPSVTYAQGQELFYTSGISIQAHKSSGYRTIQMRSDIKPFDNVYLRQAVANCLDRPGMVASLIGGYGTLGNDSYFAPVFPVSKLAISKIPQRTQNIRLAKQLLAKGGKPRGFAVTLTTEDYQEIPLLAQTIKANCALAGIDVKLNVESQGAYYGPDWLSVPFGITDWGARGVPSQGIAPAYTSKGTWNSAHWKNPQFDKLFTQFNSELDVTKSEQLAEKMALLMHTQVPDAIAYWLDDTQAYRKGVNIGYAPSNFVNVTNMWLPA